MRRLKVAVACLTGLLTLSFYMSPAQASVVGDCTHIGGGGIGFSADFTADVSPHNSAYATLDSIYLHFFPIVNSRIPRARFHKAIVRVYATRSGTPALTLTYTSVGSHLVNKLIPKLNHIQTQFFANTGSSDFGCTTQ